MLANLLPGLRELRVPLAAGYLWLMFLWLLAEPYLPSAQSAEGVIDSFYGFFKEIGALGGGVATSFVAYLIGTVSEALTEPAVGRMLRRHDRFSTPGGLSKRGWRSINVLVEEEVRSLDARLRRSGLSLADAEERETRSELVATAGFTQAEAHEATTLLEELQRRRVTPSQFIELKTLESQLTDQGMSLAEVSEAIETERKITGTGFTQADVQWAASVRDRMRRHGLDESGFDQMKDQRLRLAGLGVTPEGVTAADEVERQMELRGLSLDSPRELEILQARRESGNLDPDDAERLLELEVQMAQVPLTRADIVVAQETKSRLTRAGFTFDVGRILAQARVRLEAARLTEDEVERSLQVLRALGSLGLSVETVNSSRAILARLRELNISEDVVRECEATRSRLGRFVSTTEAVETAKRIDKELAEGRGPSTPGAEHGMWQTRELPHLIASELDLIMTRLLGEQPELHSAADRLRAEGEFRFAIIPPLVALVVFLVAEWHVSWLLLAAPLAVLFRDGLRRRRAAGDLLADALALGRVKAPALEKFAASVADVERSRRVPLAESPPRPLED